MPTMPSIAPPRRRVRVITALVAIVLVVGTIVVVVTRGPSVGEIPSEGPWSIGISHPGGPQGDVTSCVRDRSVSSSLMSADLPSSGTSIQLEDSATRDDVQRVLDCLDRALSGGDISVITRR
ncbi:hypothetical protein [Sanguibacter sp. 25GB23B1]|uniref:hypothetical protein n=1 Tax=unclassified Sanguibacter TaxID=2645534 RepID=UPI0032AF539A